MARCPAFSALGLAGGDAEYVSCFGSGTIRQELIAHYGSPFAVETAQIKVRGTDLSARVIRSLFDTARLGLLDERWEITPQAGNWVTLDRRPWEARCMEVYAAMLDCMDQGIGRLVETLKKNGQYKNTLILYLQDNGACAETIGRNGPHQPRAEKLTLPPLAKGYIPPGTTRKQTRDGYPVREGQGVMPGGADTFVAYGLNWANISNTPFREYKHWQHEGGISTPFIAHWPKGIAKEARNKRNATPAHLIDIMATCVDVSGANYPKGRKGNTIQPMEGISFAPAFSERPITRAQPLFWEHEGNRAIRSGGWKLVSKHPGAWELYNMTADRTEMNDLAAKQPDRVKDMAVQWDAWAKRVGALPWPLGGGKAKMGDDKAKK